jgi:multiple sugar transport system permease protein
MIPIKRDRAVLWIGVTAILLWTIVPFVWTFWASLMTDRELLGGIVRPIERPTFDSYMAILGIINAGSALGGQVARIVRGLINSISIAIPVAIIATAFAIIAGYAFGRFDFPAKKTLLFILLSSRMLPPVAILIPYFILLKSVGLIGNPVGLIIMYLTSVVPLLTWLLMGYFATLPLEIERAARMDGCSRLGTLWYIMIPMALPGIVAAFIISFLFAWNELLFAIVLTGGTPAETLSPAIVGLSPTAGGSFTPGFTMFAAASMISVIPPLILATIFQRYITSLNIVDPVTAGRG